MTHHRRLVSATGSRRRSSARESQIVLGIDPDPARLWPDTREANGEQRERVAVALVDTADAAGAPAPAPAAAEAAAAVQVHCRALIDAAGPACVAVKPQLACFERLGSAGWLALEATCEHARAAGLLVLADGKRGDVPVTATAYAQALVGSTPSPFGAVPGLQVDAFTANPLLGRDALEPLVEIARTAGAGVFLLVRTSNPGAADVLDLRLATGEPLWERLAALAAELGEGSPLADVGAVTGATVPEHLARMRELMPRTPFLLPGVGRPGRRRPRPRAGVRGRPRRRPRDRVALDRQRARAGAAERPPRRRAARPSACVSSHGASSDAGIIALMARRSPARFLAPLALVGFVVALFVVVDNTRDGSGTREGGAQPAASASATPAKSEKAKKLRRTYRVKPGDTPSSIAEKTNVPLSQIQELNPNLDDQTLAVGQKIKLRP